MSRKSKLGTDDAQHCRCGIQEELGGALGMRECLYQQCLSSSIKDRRDFLFGGGGGLISKIVRKPLATAGRGYVDNDGSKEIFGTRVWLAVVVDIS